MIVGFSINDDGSLAPVPGSPFLEASPAHAIANLGGNLVVADAERLRVFAVDKETGSIRPTDSMGLKGISSLVSDPSRDGIFATTPTGMIALRVEKGKLQPASPAAPPIPAAQSQAVLDATGKFMYAVDRANSELRAFRVDGRKAVPQSPPSYPLPKDAAFITLVESLR